MRDDTDHTVPHGKYSVDVSETLFLRKWTLKCHRARDGGLCRLLSSGGSLRNHTALLHLLAGAGCEGCCSGFWLQWIVLTKRSSFSVLHRLKQVKCELLNQPGDSWVAVLLQSVRHSQTLCKIIYDLHLKCCTDPTETFSKPASSKTFNFISEGAGKYGRVQGQLIKAECF